MSLLLTNSAEGGSDGTTVTAANSGGASGTAWDSLTIGSGATGTFSATQAAHGALSYEITTPSTAVAVVFNWNGAITTSPTTIWGRAYVYLPSLPSASIRILKYVDSSSTLIAALDINSSGKVLTRNAAAATITTSTLPVPTGKWFRIEWMVVSSATVGQTEVKLFISNLDATTPDETDTSTATQATNGNSVFRFQLGCATSVANVGIFLDDIGLSDSGYLGPSGISGTANFTGWGMAI